MGSALPSPTMHATLGVAEQRRVTSAGATSSNASGSGGGAEDGTGAGIRAADKEAVREHVERASKLLDDMLEEIMSELFVDHVCATKTAFHRPVIATMSTDANSYTHILHMTLMLHPHAP